MNNPPQIRKRHSGAVSPGRPLKDIPYVKELREQGSSKPVSKWLELDAENLTGKVVSLPARDDIDLTIEEHLIVEYYSR